MIHLTNEEYDNLLRHIDEKKEYIALCVKERNEQKQRVDECFKAIDNLGRCVKLQEEKINYLEKRWSELKDSIKSDLVEAEGYEDQNKMMDLIEILDKMQRLEDDTLGVMKNDKNKMFKL